MSDPTQSFLKANARWLVGGLLLTFLSSFGQTFFISLFAAEIRQEFGLSHGQFGVVYMTSTLGSALVLVALGQVLDWIAMYRVAIAVILSLGTACLVMAATESLMILVLAIFMLRLFGQGMMTHTALTIIGRSFSRQRGRAVSITTLGHQLGEGLLPLTVVGLLTLMDWRTIWQIAAVFLVAVAAPMIFYLLRVERNPADYDAGVAAQPVRQWTRREVVFDPLFWILCLGVLAPSFIGTSFLFHQVHIGTIKGWSRELIAGAFMVWSVTTIVMTLIAGEWVDRFSARQLLPFFLLPMGLACLLLATFSHPGIVFIFMIMLGFGGGLISAMFGSLWPEVYGTQHLGAIRALAVTAMVLASAVGPGLTGTGIDHGFDIERQFVVMGIYCLCTAAIMYPVSLALGRRLIGP